MIQFTKYYIPLLFVLISSSIFATGSDTLALAYAGDIEMHNEITTVDTSIIISSLDTVLVGDSLLTEKVFSPLDSLNLSYFSRCVLEDSLYWMGIDSTYAIWDSLTVNPYKSDGAKFKDTNSILLHDHCSLEEWSMPLDHDHYITSKFGLRRYKYHYGTDLRLSIGDTISSVWDGVIRISKYNYGGYGNYVVVRHHNGLETIYGHMSKRLVKVGQEVKAGEVIGLGGNTGRSSGPHLHFEVRYEGNAIDPTHIFSFDNNAIACNEFDVTPNEFEYIRELRKAKYYKIRSGDTLGHIAIRYHTSITQICRLNGMTRNSIIRVGKTLRVR